MSKSTPSEYHNEKYMSKSTPSEYHNEKYMSKSTPSEYHNKKYMSKSTQIISRFSLIPQDRPSFFGNSTHMQGN